MYYIFDLDNTVIDSSHRQTFVDGKLDLDAWKRDNTKKNIRKDSLLPIANIMKSAKRFGHHVIVCTARLCAWDLNLWLIMGCVQYPFSRPIGKSARCGTEARSVDQLFLNDGRPLARWYGLRFSTMIIKVFSRWLVIWYHCKRCSSTNTELRLARKVRA